MPALSVNPRFDNIIPDIRFLEKVNRYMYRYRYILYSAHKSDPF